VTVISDWDDVGVVAHCTHVPVSIDAAITTVLDAVEVPLRTQLPTIFCPAHVVSTTRHPDKCCSSSPVHPSLQSSRSSQRPVKQTEGRTASPVYGRRVLVSSQHHKDGNMAVRRAVYLSAAVYIEP